MWLTFRFPLFFLLPSQLCEMNTAAVKAAAEMIASVLLNTYCRLQCSYIVRCLSFVFPQSSYSPIDWLRDNRVIAGRISCWKWKFRARMQIYGLVSMQICCMMEIKFYVEWFWCELKGNGGGEIIGFLWIKEAC